MTSKPSDNSSLTPSDEAKTQTSSVTATAPSQSKTAGSVSKGGSAASARGAHIAQELGPAPTGSFASNDEVLIRKKRRHHKKRRRAIRIAIIVVVVLIAIGVGAAFAFQNAIKSGEQALHQASQTASVDTAENSVSYDEGRTVTYNGHTYKLNENMVSVVVMGYDRTATDEANGQNGQADAVMVLALDTQSGKAIAIGVPRDSMVDVSKMVGGAYGGQDKMQLCLAFAYGDGAEGSAENVTTAVSRVLYNMPMSYYLAFDMQGVGALNDAVGGVVIDPLQSIPGTDIVEGSQTILFGDNALKYVQWRDTSELTSPLDRQDRQVQYVKAFASTALTRAKGNVTSIVELFNTARDYSITNLGLNEFSYLATKVVGTGVTSLDVITLKGEAKQGDSHMEYYLDKDSVYQTVLDVYYTQVS